MEIIVQALKENRSYDELSKLWTDWDSDMKQYLFLDLAIVHRCKDGIQLIGDLLGPSIYLTPYDVSEKVTPLYIAQLLSRSHQDYAELASYMCTRIEFSQPWNRRKSFLWVWKHKKTPKLPTGILKMLVTEFL
jgi:hypothetical protein